MLASVLANMLLTSKFHIYQLFKSHKYVIGVKKICICVQYLNCDLYKGIQYNKKSQQSAKKCTKLVITMKKKVTRNTHNVWEKHCENRKSLPWEHHIVCQMCQVVLSKSTDKVF